MTQEKQLRRIGAWQQNRSIDIPGASPTPRQAKVQTPESPAPAEDAKRHGHTALRRGDLVDRSLGEE
jgi:hypothetical protein